MAKLQDLLYRTYQNRAPFLGRNARQAGCLARLYVAVEQRMTGLEIEGCQASRPHAMLCHQFLPITAATLSIIIITNTAIAHDHQCCVTAARTADIPCQKLCKCGEKKKEKSMPVG